MIEEKNELTGQILSSDNNMSSLIEKKETLEGQLISNGNIIASLIAQKGAQGEKGDTGSQGIPGVSPIVTTSKSGKETTITIVDIEGTKTATINDGLDGSDGQDGEDGYSPEANVTKTGNTATISITDKNGTTTASVSDGNDGNDGYSPSASVTKVGKIATITITDENGTTTAEIRDGEDGLGSGDMLKATYDTNNNGIVDNAEKVNNHTVESNVPANAVFTDTTYTAGTGIDITNGVISNTQTSAEWGNITGNITDQSELNELIKKTKWSPILYAGDNNILNYINSRTGNINSMDVCFLYDNSSCCFYYSNTGDDKPTDAPTDKPFILEIITPKERDTKTWIHDNSYVYKRIRKITDIDGNIYYQKLSFTYDDITFTPTFGNWNQILDESNLAETDPVFTASASAGITSSDISNWNNKSDFSGSYNDLTNKPTIPTVNNATLTLQKNGTTLDTFTANSSVDKTVNISVPTSTSDLTNDSGFINNSVNNLTNYYTKSNVYNKTEMGDIFSAYDSIIAGKQGTISEQTDFNAGDIVVNSIRTKNMFDKSTFVQGNEKNASPTIRVSSRQILYLEPGTYTFSCSIPSSMTTEVMVLTDKPGNTTNTYVYDSSWVSSPHTFTIASAGYFCINVRNNNGNTINVSDISSYNFQIEEGSTATTYSDYQALKPKNYVMYTDNNWIVKKYNDGTFEAWYPFSNSKTTTTTGTLFGLNTTDNLIVAMPSLLTSNSNIYHYNVNASFTGQYSFPIFWIDTANNLVYRLVSNGAITTAMAYRFSAYISGKY